MKKKGGETSLCPHDNCLLIIETPLLVIFYHSDYAPSFKKSNGNKNYFNYKNSNFIQV